MQNADDHAPIKYSETLRAHAAAYRRAKFSGQDELFEPRTEGGPIVFLREHAARNILVPDSADADAQRHIVGLIPATERHRYFRSMRSSQALAQSVFGTIAALRKLALLADIRSDNDRLAFGPNLAGRHIELEKRIDHLGEPRPTSVDVWLGGDYQVAIECKLAESDFGTCSRPRSSIEKPDYCDGSYTHQRGRTERCSLTESQILYWRFIPELFGWPSNEDHRPCLMASVYQLARNVMAACVRSDRVDVEGAHALVIYDERNPTMQENGEGNRQWQIALDATRTPGVLRRLSWQSLIAQWPDDPILNWLKAELSLKYGLRAR